MGQLDEEAARGRAITKAEEGGVALGRGARAQLVARPQATGQLAVAAAGQCDEALGVFGKEGLGEPRDRLRTGHVGPRHEPAQAPPAYLRASKQDEMRSARSLTDPSQVFLDGLAMPWQPGARGARPAGQTLGHARGERFIGGPAAASSRAPGRDDQSIGVRDGRVEQFDLETHDRVEAGRLGRRHEPDRAVQAVVIGDGEAGQPERNGPLDQIVRR